MHKPRQAVAHTFLGVGGQQRLRQTVQVGLVWELGAALRDVEKVEKV